MKVKVKVTLVQALRLCTVRTAHRGSRGIALPFHDHGTRRGEGSASRPSRSLPPEKIRYPLYRRLVGPQGRYGQVWKISALPTTGIRSPDRPARSQSLYRLSYPIPISCHIVPKIQSSQMVNHEMLIILHKQQMFRLYVVFPANYIIVVFNIFQAAS